MENQKDNGAYYTPEYLSDFIVDNIFANYVFDVENINVLEPSCGDGIFIKSLLNNNSTPSDVPLIIDVVEKNKKEIEKVKLYDLNRFEHDKLNLFPMDFLEFNSNGKKYDLIIGNPPYINKRILSEQQIINSKEIFIKQKLEPRNFNNIWMSFLIKSISMLKPNGVLCFVLPTELLQVNYSKELRRFLLDNFKKIQIYIFDDLVFEKIEQDVLLLFISIKGKTTSIDYFQVNDLDDIKIKSKLIPNRVNYKKQEKWSDYLLSNTEIDFIQKINHRFLKISDFCTSTAGIVTAANDFFIVNKSCLMEYDLLEHNYPILKKSSYIPKGIKFTNEEFNKLVDKEIPTHLLFFDAKNINDYSGRTREYLNKGLDEEIHNRYKCKKRSQWYKVPFLKPSDGIFFKRSNVIPKIIVNLAEVLNTDSGYRINMKEGYDIHSLVFSFYNSLTLVMSELNGRSYGGGVLELTPNEFKGLPIPYCKVTENDFNHLDNLFKEEYSIEEILNYSDEYLLKNNFQLTNEEIKLLKLIRRKLIRRRF